MTTNRSDRDHSPTPETNTTYHDRSQRQRLHLYYSTPVLRVLLAEEVTGRDAATRRKTANFPTGKTFSSWKSEESLISEATQQSLMTLEWIGRHENLAVAGPSGTGKSHFVEALAHAAIEKDLRVS
jgi:DNA replication protein DnaC